MNPDGTIERYKARFVAQGYRQSKGIDYQETFSPTVRANTVRVLTQVACNKGWSMHHLDVKTAYLNTDIDCEIFMEQPQGFEKEGNNGEKLFCKLKKSIYGLRQSGRLWNQCLHDFLVKIGFVKSEVDHCLYSKCVDDYVCKLIVFVDDIIIACGNVELLNETKLELQQRFKMSDLGILRWFMGIEFSHDIDSISLNQSLYLTNLLKKHGMDLCKPVGTPCEKDAFDVDDDDDVLPDVSLNIYRSIVGSLIYAMHYTRPDLRYVI
jgi:hypothetical protein